MVRLPWWLDLLMSLRQCRDVPRGLRISNSAGPRSGQQAPTRGGMVHGLHRGCPTLPRRDAIDGTFGLNVARNREERSRRRSSMSGMGRRRGFGRCRWPRAPPPGPAQARSPPALQPTTRVLTNGASGGQLRGPARQGLRGRGDRCDQHPNLELVRSLGADHVLDAAPPPPPTSPTGPGHGREPLDG
jgi:hypothetical protein